MSHFPLLASDDEIWAFIEKRDIQRRLVGNPWRFFSQFEDNLLYRDLEFVSQERPCAARFDEIVRFMLSEYQETAQGFAFNTGFYPYFDPRSFLVEFQIEVGRCRLPDNGYLRIWLPLPLHSPSEDDIDILKVSPFEALVNYPRLDGNIGYAFFEFYLASVIVNLEISIIFSFSHFRQQFDIDPATVGEYNTESVLFSEYTASFGNIYFDENSTSLAKSIVGEEANAYLQAKKLFYYVVENVHHSFAAHSAIEAGGISESFYAYEHHFGDCGMQSMFFAALCRSIGIPARTPGGFQLFSGQLGSHFWAEFFLPSHGWIPVDTSADQLANYALNVTDDERKTFIDFFVANQESLRMLVQNSIDREPEEGPFDIQYLSLAMQLPFIDCKIENEDLSVSFNALEGFSMNTTVIC
ncbi:MAG: transglutaminase-like domain-containing protein [Kosmotogaceae bacterium]